MIAQIGFTVLFDNEIYQDRRLALLEREAQELAARLDSLRRQNRALQAQVDGYWWLLPLGVAIVFFVYLSLKFAIVPVWAFWTNLGVDFDPTTLRQARLLMRLTNYYSPSELAEHQPWRRLIGPDPWAVRRLAERVRSYRLAPAGPRKLAIHPADPKTWRRRRP